MNYIKVLLINPPLTAEERFKVASEKEISIVPPLGLCYLAAALEQHGTNVNIWDGLIEYGDDNYTIRRIKKEKADIIGITSTTISMPKAITLANIIKKKIDKKIPIILGGAHATALPKETLEAYDIFDIICIGESERTITELIDYYNGKKKIENIKGIAYKTKRGIKITKSRDLIKDLDTIPHPSRHLLPDLKKYTPARKYKRYPVTSMITSRGCPFRCIFCDHSIFGKSYRTHSAEYVIDEIESLVEKYKIKEISFSDDNFMLDRDRVKKINNLIKERNLNITWTCQGRVGNADLELFKQMKKSGCWLFHMGIESGNSKVLKDIKKDITKNQVIETTKIAKKAGIQTWGFFILGHPTDTYDTMMDTINFAASLPLDYVGFNIAVHYPGSELYKTAKKHGKFKSNNFSDYMVDPNNPVFIAKNTTKEELMYLKRLAYRKFYFRLNLMINHLRNIENIHDIEKYIYGAINMLKR